MLEVRQYPPNWSKALKNEDRRLELWNNGVMEFY